MLYDFSFFQPYSVLQLMIDSQTDPQDWQTYADQFISMCFSKVITSVGRKDPGTFNWRKKKKSNIINCILQLDALFVFLKIVLLYRAFCCDNKTDVLFVVRWLKNNEYRWKIRSHIFPRRVPSNSLFLVSTAPINSFGTN